LLTISHGCPPRRRTALGRLRVRANMGRQGTATHWARGGRAQSPGRRCSGQGSPSGPLARPRPCPAAPRPRPRLSPRGRAQRPRRRRHHCFWRLRQARPLQCMNGLSLVRSTSPPPPPLPLTQPTQHRSVRHTNRETEKQTSGLEERERANTSVYLIERERERTARAGQSAVLWATTRGGRYHARRHHHTARLLASSTAQLAPPASGAAPAPAASRCVAGLLASGGRLPSPAAAAGSWYWASSRTQ
jgi:hypothetical protein